MATELELKLMIQPTYIESASSYLNELCNQSESCSVEPSLALMNGYFDTPDDLLMQSGIALRIRAVNQEFIQTLKTRGSSRVGMHVRGEWEWKIKCNILDLSLLNNEMLPANLHDRKWTSDLLEVFRTDFNRKVWLFDDGHSKMEVVVDQGLVTSPFGTEPINELEIELKSGKENGLFDFAIKLAETIPVQVSMVSKAAKGMRLKNNRIVFPEPPPSDFSELSLSVYWYEMWLAYWEAMCFLNDPALLIPVCDSMEQLSKYLAQELSQPLTQLNRELNLAFHHSKLTTPRCLAQTLSVGQVMLKIGYWLNQNSNKTY